MGPGSFAPPPLSAKGEPVMGQRVPSATPLQFVDCVTWPLQIEYALMLFDRLLATYTKRSQGSTATPEGTEPVETGTARPDVGQSSS